MTIVLATKPGLTGANTLDIPKDWDAKWFRNLINNKLKGGDVRNAVGTNGITVSGTIASPYATISLGAGPIIIPAAPPGGTTLTVGGPPGGTAIATSNPGANGYTVLSWANSAGSGFLDLTNAGTTRLEASGQIQFGAGNAIRMLITAAGAIQGLGPISAAFTDMTPDGGQFTLTHTGFTAGVTSTATWYRIGNIVILNTGSVSGTSNATTWTATGLPAGLAPARGQTIALADMTNNGANVFGNVTLAIGSSTLSFGNGPNANAAWTNTGAKGFANTGGTTFCYLLS